MTIRNVLSIVGAMGLSLLTAPAVAGGLDLEGYKVLVEKQDDGTMFNMKAIVFEVQRSVFPGDDVPKAVMKAAASFCQGYGEPVEAGRENKGKASYLVSYRCPDRDPSVKIYGLVASGEDWVRCSEVGAVSPQRAQGTIKALETTQKSAVVLDCLDKEGWVRLRNPGGGTGGRPDVKHAFLGDKGNATCHAIEASFRDLAPKLFDKATWLVAFGNKDCRDCVPNGDTLTLRLSQFAHQSRSCDPSKDSEYVAKVKGALESKAKGTADAKSRQRKVTNGPNGKKIAGACERLIDLEHGLQELNAQRCDPTDSACNNDKMRATNLITQKADRIFEGFKKDAKTTFLKKWCCDALPEDFIAAGGTCIAKPIDMYAH